jgi:hypothetical protein
MEGRRIIGVCHSFSLKPRSLPQLRRVGYVTGTTTMSEPDDPLLGKGGGAAAGDTGDRVARVIQVTGKVILWLDLVWAITWFVIACIMSNRVTPLPSTLVSGLPLSVYDGTAEYRNAHYGLAFHGFLPSVYFSLAAGYSHEPLVAWYALPIGFAVATDVYANTQNWPHLSRDSIPEFFVMESVMATAAVMLSTAVFLWYQAAYWHFHFTGRHFNASSTVQQQYQLHRQDDANDGTAQPPSSLPARDQRVRLPYPGSGGVAPPASTQPRLRLPLDYPRQ